jgi:hypothetical protein
MNKVISAVLFIVMGLALFPIISGYADEATQEAEFIQFVEGEDVTFSEDMTIKLDSDGSYQYIELTLSLFMEDDGGGDIYFYESDGSPLEDFDSPGGIIEVNINATTWIGTHEVIDAEGVIFYRDNTLTGHFADSNLEGLINMLPLLSLISIIVGVTMLIQIKEDD